ncbi:MAG TPA: dihydroneopterin aldolase [Candidatus Limnocylindria bacterium]|nr:dihydroneopterin aldolase [Candidatus Limnocylindria bacterium]
MPAALPARIVIRGLRCRGRQGPAPADHERLHDYLVDVSLAVDIGDAVARDDLAGGLDIAAVAAAVRDEVGRRPRTLLERMTSDVAHALVRRFDRVTEVSVRVEKLEPDGLDAAAEAVEITISR